MMQWRVGLQFAANVLLDTDHFCLAIKRSTFDGGVVTLPPALAGHFTRIPDDRGGSEHAVFVMPRANVLPDLLVRAARVEDHDDLVPVFESRSEVVQETFGTYFLAEVIEQQSDERKVLVGEGPDGHAVGLIALAANVDADLLNACFDLQPYAGLVKRSRAQELVDTRASVVSARRRA